MLLRREAAWRVACAVPFLSPACPRCVSSYSLSRGGGGGGAVTYNPPHAGRPAMAPCRSQRACQRDGESRTDDVEIPFLISRRARAIRRAIRASWWLILTCSFNQRNAFLPAAAQRRGSGVGRALDEGVLLVAGEGGLSIVCLWLHVRRPSQIKDGVFSCAE